MKKFSLIGVLLLFIIGTIGCESVVQEVDYDNDEDTCYEVDYDNDEDTCYEEVTITGKIISTSLPCPPPGMVTITIDALAIIVNNTTYFFPRTKEGRLIYSLCDFLEGYSWGDMITVRGKISEIECYCGREAYSLEIIEIILKDYTIVTGKIEYGHPPNSVATIVIPWVVNDTDSFVLRKNGKEVWSISELEGYSIGDKITIRGKVSEGKCVGFGKFYFLDIIEIIE